MTPERLEEIRRRVEDPQWRREEGPVAPELLAEVDRLRAAGVDGRAEALRSLLVATGHPCPHPKGLECRACYEIKRDARDAGIET